jgi:hypothetical protein
MSDAYWLKMEKHYRRMNALAIIKLSCILLIIIVKILRH